jgi:hypothetical protein
MMANPGEAGGAAEFALDSGQQIVLWAKDVRLDEGIG